MAPILKYKGSVIAKNIEFARTLASKIKGLMFRKSIPDDYAMIFTFERPTSIDVHMLFVFFPLDIIFLDNDKKISGYARLKPWLGYKVMKNIKYLIEMKAGTIEKYSISIGRQMEFEE
jgi:uncharacterized membrane protein (UPF0127 family)